MDLYPKPDMQDQLHQLQRLFGVAVKEPVITHPAEALSYRDCLFKKTVDCT